MQSMSDTGKSNREWRFYLDDMIVFAEAVQRYTLGMDKAGFIADRLTYDATLRNLELIGEAPSHIPEDVRSRGPGVPWRMLVSTRNRLIHAYLGIDNDILWSIVEADVPELIGSLKQFRQENTGP
jgi:uncharacterized protein with HEPN domain